MSDRETQPGSIIPGVDWESGVKGVTANLSLAPLADLVLAAEQAVKHDDTEHENECIDAMSRELDAVIKALSKL